VTPEDLLAHAERVRQAYLTERKLHQVDSKVASGHLSLAPFRDRLAVRLTTTVGER
jgi:hypothetical protein